MSCPSAVTVPELALTIPQTMLISVVLPAPLGPSRAKISPRRMSRSTPLRAWKPEAEVLVRLRMVRMGGMGGMDFKFAVRAMPPPLYRLAHPQYSTTISAYRPSAYQTQESFGSCQ